MPGVKRRRQQLCCWVGMLWFALAQEYRFVFIQVRAGHLADAVALGEVEMLSEDGSLLPIASIRNPEGSQREEENAARAADGVNATKWIDTSFHSNSSNSSVLHITLSDPPLPLAGYRFFTANDAPQRDPISWRLERLEPLGTWALLHEVHHVEPPGDRSAPYFPWPAVDAFWLYAPPPPPAPEYRLVVTATREMPGSASQVQLAELILWTNDTLKAPIWKTTNPGGHSPFNQGAYEATDLVVETKWLDLNFVLRRRSELRVTLAAHVAVSKYEMITANDAPKRDPVSWVFEVRQPNGSWARLSEVLDFDTPSDRFVPFGAPFDELRWPPPLPSSPPTPSPPPAAPPRPPADGLDVEQGLTSSADVGSTLMATLIPTLLALLLCICGCIVCWRYDGCPAKVKIMMPGWVAYFGTTEPAPDECLLSPVVAHRPSEACAPAAAAHSESLPLARDRPAEEGEDDDNASTALPVCSPRSSFGCSPTGLRSPTGLLSEELLSSGATPSGVDTPLSNREKNLQRIRMIKRESSISSATSHGHEESPAMPSPAIDLPLQPPSRTNPHGGRFSLHGDAILQLA
ncbi:hypothetical protein AB1Y20_000372 [Prymnesium parvum]|uniref:Uncharacterized protein n=1 Tax=Prymnesium parvum TaxID=97485 RepID=A0AB34K8A3_PRYPA